MHSLALLPLFLASIEAAVTFGPSPYGWTSTDNAFQIKGTTGVAAMQLTVVTATKVGLLADSFAA
jgi:hypothetical protein